MSSGEELRRVEEVFHRLADLPAEEREAVLAPLRASAPAVYAAVARLLAVEDRGDAVSREQLLPPSAAAPSLVGERIGRVRVESLLGVGGFGDVYAGYDEVLQRRVAVKALRRGPDDPAAKARFLREARILSRLDHPNVCRIHDVVERVDGDVLVLELVEGRTLAEVAAEELAPAHKLAVARQVAAALAAAHREGIVHRDLKAENVMLRGDGSVKVLDFGIALAVSSGRDGEAATAAAEEAAAAVDEGPTVRLPARQPAAGSMGSVATLGATTRGTVVGTIRCMSPEQAVGDPATAASDMYSFGILMQELWSGRSAYPEGLELFELLEKVRWAQTLPPSTGDRELDTLVARLQSLDPRQRPSAGASLERLDRIARRGSRRRRRARLAGVAAAAAIVAAAGVYLAVERWRSGLCAGAEARLAEVWNPERGSAMGSAFAATGVPFAPAAAERVQAALERFGVAWVAMRRDACAATHLRGEQSAELLDRRMACLDRRLGELDALVTVLEQADPGVVERSVSAASRLPDLALCADRELLAARIPPPTDPAARRHQAEAEELVAAGRAHLAAGRHPEALELARRAVAAAEASGHAPALAEARHLEGSAAEWLGEFDAARTGLEAALAAALAGGHDEILVRALSDLVWLDGNDLAEITAAERWARLGEARLRFLAAGGELAAELASNYGSALMVAGRFELARQQLEQARALFTAALGPDNIRTAGVTGNLANLAYAEARYRDSVELGRLAVAASEAALGPRHPRVALVLANLGAALSKVGELEEARALHSRALEIERASYGAEASLTGHSLVNLATAELLLDEWEPALGHFRQAGELLAGAYPPDHPIHALAARGIGDALVGLGRAAEAQQYLEQALALRPPGAGMPADRPLLQFSLARALWEGGGSRRRALALAQEARQALRELDGEAEALAQLEVWLGARESS
ncbi:MAG TPA: serine/threonine-protein kinase [Thermoanaerobaculia bacterium]|nr:serine/threonine-protein kinase [Thermoanaerobaculia bacterium]